jgi:phosphate transport system permease protein
MNPTVLFIVILFLSVAGYFLGRRKALLVGQRAQGVRNMHSKPVYYGALTGLWCGIPALIIMGIWLSVGPNVVMGLVVEGLPPEIRDLPKDRLNLVVNDIHNLVGGNIISGEKSPLLVGAADHYRRLTSIGHGALTVAALAVAIPGHAPCPTQNIPPVAGEKPGGTADSMVFDRVFLHCHIHHYRYCSIGPF